MAIYRKTTPSSYPNTPASNFTDTSKHWRQHKNIYRKTSGLETASLTAVPGRYTDDTRTWRRIKSIYRFTSSNTWQKIFGKFAGQPYPETAAKIRYSSYTGTDVGDFAMMGPGSESIAQGGAAPTFLWGRDGQDWQNIETLASRSRTFVFGDRPLPELAQQVTNDEGNFEGDKLRNSEAVISQYDGKYVWYRDRISTAGTSTGTSYSQTVKIIKQQPVINSLGFKTNNVVSAGSVKYVSFSLANEWYRSINQSTSIFKWYILDTQFETPTETKLWNSTFVSSVILTEDATTLTGEDYFTIPATFGGVSTTGKWLHVKLICKNSSSNTDVEYSVAPYNDVTDYVVAQITGAVPIGTNATVTMSRENTSYSVSVASGNTGTWSNTPTSYRYQWYLQEQTVGSSYTWSPISGATSSTYNAVLYKPSDTSTTNRIVPVVWATNGAGESNQGNALTNSGGVAITSTAGGITIANPTSSTSAMIKYKLPTITTFTVTKGTRKITYVSNFSADDPGVTTATMSWTGQAISSIAVGSSASAATYQPLAAGTYNFTLTATNVSTNALSGSATATQNGIVVDAISSYTFAFGNTFYVGTNGSIYLDVASGTTTPQSDSQRVISIFPKDLNQGSNGGTGADGNGFLLRWSDANDYVIRWDGYIDGQAGVSSYRLTYYVRFYKDQSYCDVYIENKGSLVGSPNASSGFYFDGTVVGASLANPAQGSTFRIYMDGQTGSLRTNFAAELPVAADMVSAGAATGYSGSYPAADEGYTAITTAANVYTLPTLAIGTITSDEDSIFIPYTTGGSYARFDIDVKTGSQNGTSISGYPKVDQTTATPISVDSLSGSTTYYVKITPKNTKGQLGTAQTDSKATTAALGAFTIYAYNASVAPSVPSTPTITRQSSTSNNLLIEWASTKPSNVASYNEILWGEAFSATYTTEASPFVGAVSTINRYTSTATYNESTGTYEDFWVITSASTTAKAFNVKVQAVGTNASRTAGVAWGESTNAGSYTVEYTISGSSTAANNKAYTSSVLSSTARSLTVVLGTAGGTLTVNQVKAWSNTDGTGTLKYGSLQVGQSLSVTPSPATSAASSTASGNFIYYTAVAKPTISTAPAVTRDSASTYAYTTTNGTWTGSPTSYAYQWYYSRYLPYPPYYINGSFSGATSSSYTTSSSYVDYSIYCIVTATNDGGDSDGASSNSLTVTTATVANTANNKPQGAPVIAYDSASSTSTKWAYDVTITKSTIGSPEPEYYLQWFGSANASNYVEQTGPYTNSGLGGSFVVQNVLVSKTYTLYGCQAWARNGVTGQDISNTAMSNSA